ncbi:MAG: hypothetical protein LBS88_01995 [Tannerellaceae bacterium]|jgi:uroporphyrinogen decarboxylase|nr:hypothetical protein [Tannerellaceae bacterium]
MNKRTFLKKSTLAAGSVGLLGSTGLLSSCAKKAQNAGKEQAATKAANNENKREKTLAVFDQSKPNSYVPAAFFMHFDEKLGEGAVKRHIEFFRATNMDFEKIQYEVVMPYLENIKSPKDWKNIPVYGKDFFEPQLRVIEALTKELQAEALIIPTVYSPLLSAGSTVGIETFLRHVQEDPDEVAKGFQNFAESIVYFIKEAKKIGVDGFYLSTHGGDKALFSNGPLFHKLIEPYDRYIFEEATAHTLFNILHICSVENTYQELDHLAGYPASVINPPVLLNDGSKTDLKGVQQLFRRPVMSGLDHHGVIAHGTLDEIKKEVDDVFRNNAPRNFIFAANCTVPGDTSWETLRGVIDYAHTWRTEHV